MANKTTSRKNAKSDELQNLLVSFSEHKLFQLLHMTKFNPVEWGKIELKSNKYACLVEKNSYF